MRSRTEKALVVICSLLAIAQAVLVTYFGYANFYRDYHAALLIVAMLLGGLLSSAVSCVFHELGHILFGKNIGAHLVRVIDNIPKVFNQLFGIRQVNGVQGFVIVFLNTKQNDTTESVGERGIGFPNALGQAAEGFLGLFH